MSEEEEDSFVGGGSLSGVGAGGGFSILGREKREGSADVREKTWEKGVLFIF